MKAKCPIPRKFDRSRFEETINKLHVNMSELIFERLSEIVVPYILENYEGFSKVEKGPEFRGTPFDFFGFKEGRPYIIEYKGSLNSFNFPGETQKRRLREILKIVKDINIALLQVKLSKGKYRIFYNDEMGLLFQGKKAKIDPIIEWIKNRVPKA